MKRRTKIIVIIVTLIIVVPTIVVPLYFYRSSRATVNSIIIDSVTTSGSHSFGSERFFNCIINISISSQSCCDTVERCIIKVDENSMKVTISIYMTIKTGCLLQAFYSGMISLFVILTYYGDWIISCNDFTIQLDISDYLQI